MKICVITGSPHRNGVTAKLTESFTAGTVQSGHQLVRFNAAQLKNLHGCLGCEACSKNGGVCVITDDMAKVLPQVIAADALVLVSPVYYFGFTAQIKTVIDRFYAKNAEMCAMHKKCILIAAGADDEDSAFEPIVCQYRTILNYLDWTDAGTLLAKGVATPEELKDKAYYLDEAYRLGITIG